MIQHGSGKTIQAKGSVQDAIESIARVPLDLVTQISMSDESGLHSWRPRQIGSRDGWQSHDFRGLVEDEFASKCERRQALEVCPDSVEDPHCAGVAALDAV